MAETHRTSTWMSRWRRRPAAQGTDWGDLGTAIGMEMALVQQSCAPEAVPGKAIKAERGAATPRWWMRRR